MFSSTFTLQVDLRIHGQDISSGEIIRERTYFFPININSHYYVLQKTKYINTKISLRKIICVNVNVICYNLNYVLPPIFQTWEIRKREFTRTQESQKLEHTDK